MVFHLQATQWLFMFHSDCYKKLMQCGFAQQEKNEQTNEILIRPRERIKNSTDIADKTGVHWLYFDNQSNKTVYKFDMFWYFIPFVDGSRRRIRLDFPIESKPYEARTNERYKISQTRMIQNYEIRLNI